MDTRAIYEDVEAIYLPIAVCVFVLFAAVVLFAVVRYRRRDDRIPSQRDESRFELVYVALLVAIAVLLVVVTFRGEDDISGEPAAASGPPLRVQVTAGQWRWRFAYPELGITVSDRRLPTLVVPTGRPIAFEGTSVDVTHAFYIPERRFKRQLFEGGVARWTLEWTEPVTQGSGQCSFYCGLEHSSMRFLVRALPPAEFDAWAEERR